MKTKLFHVLSILLILSLLIAGCKAATAEPTDEPSAPDVVEPQEPAAPEEPASMRGSAGDLSIISAWGADIANPYLTIAGSAAGYVLEPLAYRNPDAELVPVLAAEIPTLENGGVAPDLLTVTWTLRDDVLWSDGTPFTAEDVVFTFNYCANPETGCTRAQAFFAVAGMEAVDAHTVKISYKFPKAYTYDAFVEISIPILQAAQFEGCAGAAAITCTEANMAPIGTGPFIVAEYVPNDVAVYVANQNYRDPDKPYFASVTVKYGGDHVSAARAVTETDEYDIGMNTLLTRDLMEDIMAKATSGKLVSGGVTITEHYLLNQANNRIEGDLQSEWADGTNPHPFWSVPEIVQAMSMAIDRVAYADRIHGIKGFPTCSFINRPPQYASETYGEECVQQDVAGAMALLDSVGAVDTNGDGVREFAGEEMEIILHGEGGPMTEGVMALLKQWWEDIGLSVELKVTHPATYFSKDPAADTFWKFFADVQFSGISAIGGPDPQLLLSFFSTRAMITAESGWLGDNVPRLSNAEYDGLMGSLFALPLGPERYDAIKRMSDILHETGAAVALNGVGSVYAVGNDIVGFVVNGWDVEEFNIADWTRSE